MKKATDIIWAILLVGIAAFGIIRFIFISDLFKSEKNDVVVSESTVETSAETSVDPSAVLSVETSVSETVENSISEEPEVSVSEPEPESDPEPEGLDIYDPETRERIKNQVPNILKGITINECDIIFMGDSIFVFGDEKNDSIPDMLGIKYGLTTYNCSKEGIAAGQNTNKWVSQYDLAKCFATGKTTDGEDCDLFNYSLSRYFERDHSGRQLVILLDCCINDYYQHTPMEGENSFVEGYENTLLTLKGTYPDAIIICVVPNDVSHEEFGYNFNGAGYTYNMYKDRLYNIAVDYNVFCVRMDSAAGIDRNNVMEFLADGTHPNEAGRDRMANNIMDYINSILDFVNGQ